MYDGIDSDADVIPTSAQLVAGYDDGFYAWKDTDWARFPDSVHVHIVVHQSSNFGAVLDVEEGNASPAQSVDWVLMRRLAGADPTVYCNEENTLPLVQAAFKARNVVEPHYWLANYNGSQTIPVGAVAHQYESDVNWDISSVADYWPGVDPEPQGEDMALTPEDAQVILNAPVPRQGNTAGGAEHGSTTLGSMVGWNDAHMQNLTAAIQANTAALAKLEATLAKTTS
jgi:hypothetical protein